MHQISADATAAQSGPLVSGGSLLAVQYTCISGHPGAAEDEPLGLNVDKGESTLRREALNSRNTAWATRSASALRNSPARVGDTTVEVAAGGCLFSRLPLSPLLMATPSCHSYAASGIRNQLRTPLLLSSLSPSLQASPLAPNIGQRLSSNSPDYAPSEPDVAPELLWAPEQRRDSTRSSRAARQFFDAYSDMNAERASTSRSQAACDFYAMYNEDGSSDAEKNFYALFAEESSSSSPESSTPLGKTTASDLNGSNPSVVERVAHEARQTFGRPQVTEVQTDNTSPQSVCAELQATRAHRPPTISSSPRDSALQRRSARASLTVEASDGALEFLQSTVSELIRCIRCGTCSGVQLSMWTVGGKQHDVALGQMRPERPMRLNSLCNWMSTSKPVAAVAVAQLWEAGKLELDSPVCQYIPEFGVKGKHVITVAQLLIHTAGFPFGDSDMWGKMHLWDQVLQSIYLCPLEPNWSPGSRCGYHPYSAWFVLGEIVRRLDGRSFDRYVREAIFEPLGMHDCYIGMPESTFHRYKSAGRIAEMYTICSRTGRVLPSSKAVSAEEVTACVPGSNGRGPSSQWLLLWRMLLCQGTGTNGVKLLEPATVKKFCSKTRAGMFDEVQCINCDWGLGFFVDSDIVGPHASSKAFGHGGSQSSLAFADPENGLAFSVAFNGRPGRQIHSTRLQRLCAMLYEDVLGSSSVNSWTS